MNEICPKENESEASIQPSVSTSEGSPNTHLTDAFDSDDLVKEALDNLLRKTKKALGKRRKDLSLSKLPWITLRKFSRYTASYLSITAKRLILHPISYTLIIPVLLSLHLLASLKGEKSPLLDEIWIYVKLLTWWVSLGILSSVGLGTGMHTGFIFLFPHFFLICTTSEVCNSLDFDARINMWQYSMKPIYHLECITENPPEEFDNEVTFFGLVMKTWPFAIMWGLGSALGELPPYAASYAASMARVEDEGFEEIEAELHSNQWSIMKQVKGITMKLVEKYGPISVFILSCWPNAFFDLCGIICGHFMMPFWKFFIPLAIGKGIVKLFFQCCFFVFLFSSKFDQIRAHLLIELANFWPFSSWIVHKYGSTNNFEKVIINEIQGLRMGIKGRTLGLTWFSFVITFASVSMLIFLALCLIDSLAQKEQKENDEQVLQKIIELDLTNKEKMEKLSEISMDF